MSKTYCPIPWTHISLSADGSHRVCCVCVFNEMGMAKNDKGEIYNAKDTPASIGRNAQIFKNIRKSMLEETQHPECDGCWKQEKIGMRSKRQNMITTDLMSFEEAKSITNEDGSIDTINNPVKYYDLRFGNKCNLKCRSCGPMDSSQWYNDWVELWGNSSVRFGKEYKVDTVLELEQVNGNWQPKYDPFTWYKNSPFIDELFANLHHITRLYFTGGEPTIIKEHFNILEKCIDLKLSKNIQLEYNTNTTKISEKLIGYWKNFKKVSLGCSIDGISSSAEYLRFPCKWDVIEKNITELDKIGPPISCSFTTTISIYNILHYISMIKWFYSKQFKNFRLSPHPLTGPNSMTLQVLPLSAKKVIQEEYNKLYNWLLVYYGEHEKSYIFNQMQPYLNWMIEKDKSELLSKFWTTTKRMDSIRNESFEKTFPDLYELIKNYV